MQNDAATIPNYVELTSDVVSAYVSKNSVSRTDLPGLIGTVHAALSGTSTPAQPNEKLMPPVPINKTIRQVDEKRYLHRVEKLHTPVLPLACGQARGAENRDFIQEDRHSDRCWVTIATFNSLYPEIAEATDLGATLRSNVRERLPLENWEGTPLEALLRAAGIILGTPAVIALALVTWTRRKKRLA